MLRNKALCFLLHSCCSLWQFVILLFDTVAYQSKPSQPKCPLVKRLKTLAITLKPRLHYDTCCRIQVVSTCCRQHVSCIGDKIVASLSPVCCWIQRDTSRPWHKWIVIMSPRYNLHRGYPGRATCIRRHVSVDILLCIRIQVAAPGYAAL